MIVFNVSMIFLCKYTSTVLAFENHRMSSVAVDYLSRRNIFRRRMTTNEQDTTKTVIGLALKRAQNTLQQVIGDLEAPTRTYTNQAQQNEQNNRNTDSVPYSQNPLISSTAMAHTLWKHVLRPGDSAIDATCGNGNDSLEIAKILGKQLKSLVCIDIQPDACKRTREKLIAFDPDTIERTHIVTASHAPLTLPPDTSSVGLVVYNLGYLPQSPKECLTKTETTLASLADAAHVLRQGGLLSVMTYPKTNREEARVVHVFLESLALFTSSTEDWRDYVECQTDMTEDSRRGLSETLQNVLDNGPVGQTWRVHEHRKLGWTDAPILLTAIRIK